MSAKKILIVDDEPHVLEVLRVTLEDFGFKILEAMDGEDAIATVQEQRPDLVVLDVMLPGRDGQEICRQLKASSDTAAIPVIMLTARSGPENEREGLEAGADAYLTKPFSPLTLLSEVHRQLQLEIA
ncbi:MAG: response regulator transcription factor [Vulcanimicrobiota bacterium]|nr:response regulator [Candidatus Eremiobacteraeota bacterium]